MTTEERQQLTEQKANLDEEVRKLSAFMLTPAFAELDSDQRKAGEAREISLKRQSKDIGERLAAEA